MARLLTSWLILSISRPPKRSAKSKESEPRADDHRCWGLGDPSSFCPVRMTSTLTRTSSAAIAPSAARTGARIVNAPPTTTPVVSGTSSSFSSFELRMLRRRTLPSAISSLVLSTSSLPAISTARSRCVRLPHRCALLLWVLRSLSLSLRFHSRVFPSTVILAALVLLSPLSHPALDTDDVRGHPAVRIMASTIFLHGQGWAQPATQCSGGVQSGL